jgi:PleD family two-component response regulator
MAIQEDRVSLRDLGVDASPRVDIPMTDRGEVAGVLSGLVVISVGRGGPVQAAVNRALKAAGAIVMVKASTAEVVRMLGAFVPSVIVTEVIPGDDDGPAILSEIRRLPSQRGGDLPIVGVSWETLDPAPMIRAGYHGALVGPFDAADVARTVLTAVRRPR